MRGLWTAFTFMMATPYTTLIRGSAIVAIRGGFERHPITAGVARLEAFDARKNAVLSRHPVHHRTALVNQIGTPARAHTQIAEGFFYGNLRQLTRIFPMKRLNCSQWGWDDAVRTRN